MPTAGRAQLNGGRSSVRRTAARSGTATSRIGKATARRIIEGARELLMKRGYAQFSMRNVAAKSGLHLANVQYYFPRRDDLVHALLLDTGERYRAAYAACLEGAPSSPVERFRIILRWNMRDITTRATRQFFIQLWALLSVLDGHSGRLLDELYAIDIAQLGERIAEMHPKLPPQEIRRRAMVLAAMIEGMMVVRGSRSANEPEMARLIERVFGVGLQIANGMGARRETD
jgi:AcrR family transcriptional regulator